MNPKPRSSSLYPLFFLGIGVVFVGILLFAYWATRKANPVMLDEKGRPVQAQHS